MNLKSWSHNFLISFKYYLLLVVFEELNWDWCLFLTADTFIFRDRWCHFKMLTSPKQLICIISWPISWDIRARTHEIVKRLQNFFLIFLQYSFKIRITLFSCNISCCFILQLWKRKWKNWKLISHYYLSRMNQL